MTWDILTWNENPSTHTVFTSGIILPVYLLSKFWRLCVTACVLPWKIRFGHSTRRKKWKRHNSESKNRTPRNRTLSLFTWESIRAATIVGHIAVSVFQQRITIDQLMDRYTWPGSERGHFKQPLKTGDIDSMKLYKVDRISTWIPRNWNVTFNSRNSVAYKNTSPCKKENSAFGRTLTDEKDQSALGTSSGPG